MPFNLLLLAVIALGLAWPDAGLALAPSRRWLIVSVMFLMSVTLPAEGLRRAARNVRGVAACTLTGYVVVPLLAGLAAPLVFPDDAGLRTGLVLLGALPCTLASATVWTRLARGEDALALTYTIASNVGAVVVVPALLFVFLGRALPVPAQRIVGDLALVVLLPVATGQGVRYAVGARADAWKQPVSIAARGLVLAIVLVAVSSMASPLTADPSLAALPVLAGAAIHVAGLAAGWGLAARLGLPVAERIAVAFAGSQKTLFVGVFLAQEYFADTPLALLPVTAYHVLQLVVDTWLANRWSRREGASPAS